MVVVVLTGLRFPVREEIFTCSVGLSGSLSRLEKASHSENEVMGGLRKSRVCIRSD